MYNTDAHRQHPDRPSSLQSLSPSRKASSQLVAPSKSTSTSHPPRVHYLCAHDQLNVPHRIQETLPAEVLTKLGNPPKPDYPIITPGELTNFDAYLLGIPTRYGSLPAQWKVSADPFVSLATADLMRTCRHSGMPRGNSGPRVRSMENSRACSSPRALPVVAKK